MSISEWWTVKKSGELLSAEKVKGNLGFCSRGTLDQRAEEMVDEIARLRAALAEREKALVERDALLKEAAEIIEAHEAAVCDENGWTYYTAWCSERKFLARLKSAGEEK